MIWVVKSNYPRNSSKMFQEMFLSHLQGPRGMPGERGRLGPQGAPVSMCISTLSNALLNMRFKWEWHTGCLLCNFYTFYFETNLSLQKSCKNRREFPCTLVPYTYLLLKLTSYITKVHLLPPYFNTEFKK